MGETLPRLRRCWQLEEHPRKSQVTERIVYPSSPLLFEALVERPRDWLGNEIFSADADLSLLI